jgi:hypothetical protein
MPPAQGSHPLLRRRPALVLGDVFAGDEFRRDQGGGLGRLLALKDLVAEVADAASSADFLIMVFPPCLFLLAALFLLAPRPSWEEDRIRSWRSPCCDTGRVRRRRR